MVKLQYILDIKTNATIRVPFKQKKKQSKTRSRKRRKWYRTMNIVEYMKRGKNKRKVGFKCDLKKGKAEELLYTVKERVCIKNALPGTHKIVYSYDPERGSGKYLITNELTWEGLKVIKEYFFRWVIDVFFRNAKQQLNIEGACVRGEQGVTIKLLLVSYIDALFHMEIAKLVSANSQSEPISVQSVILNWFKAKKMFSSVIVEGLNNKIKPEPTHRFF